MAINQVAAEILKEQFFHAVDSNDIKKVIELVVEKGVNVNSRDEYNYHETALRKATTKCNLDMIRVLVEQLGANMKMDDDGGEIPILRVANGVNYNKEIILYFVGKEKSFKKLVKAYLK